MRQATAGASPASLAQEKRCALLLGGGLRPIFFGGAAAAVHSLPSTALQARPELIVSVHSRAGQLLGYAAVDRAVSGATWGELTVSEHLSLPDVCVLARATTLQLALFAIRRGSHHCLVSVTEGSRERERLHAEREYLDALRPLVEAGLCDVILRSNGAPELTLARDGLVASATATTLAALDHLGMDASRATVAIYRPTEVSREAAAALLDRGLRLVAEGDGTLTAGVTVLLVGAPLGSIGLREAVAARARVVVGLGAASATLAAERKLHERRLLFIPNTLAAGGRFVALDLRARGLDSRSAIGRSFATADERARALLALAEARGEPLAAVVRACASTRLAERRERGGATLDVRRIPPQPHP